MSAAPRHPSELGYNGLRMTADEYLALGETFERYELIDGVVVMTPSPAPAHNEIAAELVVQLGTFSSRTRAVRLFPETDLRLSPSQVYRPDLCAYRAAGLSGKPARLDTPPDLVVEVLSPGSKPTDFITKRDDYERFGVGEYWVIDPEDGRLRAWQRHGNLLAEAAVAGDAFASAAIPGFVLDLRRVRAIAQPEA